jgi:hypothetical protein
MEATLSGFGGKSGEDDALGSEMGFTTWTSPSKRH